MDDPKRTPAQQSLSEGQNQNHSTPGYTAPQGAVKTDADRLLDEILGRYPHDR